MMSRIFRMLFLTTTLSICLAASSAIVVVAENQVSANTSYCSPDMISYWKLDETEGTTFEDHVGSNDGVCTGDKCPFPEEGNVNGAQRFLGSEEISVPSSADFNWDGDSNFSIELWVNIPEEETSEDVKVFIGRHAGTPAWWVGHYPGSYTAAFGIRDSKGVGKEISNGPALNDEDWHHIVAVHDGDNDLLNLYVGGILVTSEEISFKGDWISDSNISIGYHNPPPYYHYSGLLDEIAVYGKALTLDEIQYHFNKGLGGKGYCEPVDLIINIEGSGSVLRSLPAPYAFGQEVTLTATPNQGFIFYNWSGDYSGYENPVTITMDQDKTITATFKDPMKDPVWYTLSVSVIGEGSVIVDPVEVEYLHGTNVTLTAVAEPGWVFGGWQGDLTGDNQEVTLLMTDNYSVTAVFTEIIKRIYLPLTMK
jgi:uncharacterized repeat protein (TIGR02543 family)